MEFACCKCRSTDLAGCARYVFLIAREVIAQTQNGTSVSLTRLEDADPLDFGNHDLSRFSLVTFGRIEYKADDYRPADWRRYRPVRRTAAFLCARCGPDPATAQQYVIAQLKEREGLWAQASFPFMTVRGDSASYNIQTSFPDDETLAWKGDVKVVFQLPVHKGMPLTLCPLIYMVDDLVQGVGELHIPSSTEILTWAGPHQISMQLAASIARPMPPVSMQCESGATYVVSPGGYDKMWGRLKPSVVQQVARGPQ
jgi:hypothetical protein